jgi:hypothetical protein
LTGLLHFTDTLSSISKRQGLNVELDATAMTEQDFRDSLVMYWYPTMRVICEFAHRVYVHRAKGHESALAFHLEGISWMVSRVFAMTRAPPNRGLLRTQLHELRELMALEFLNAQIMEESGVRMPRGDSIPVLV